MKEWLKSHLPAATRRALQAMYFETRSLTLRPVELFKARGFPTTGMKLNVGCGPNIKDSWVNIDLHPAADLRLDARRRMPFADGSADIVYSEHFLEHLEYPEDAMNFLRECLRILAPGGRFSVAVPDAERVVRAYVDNDADFFRWARATWHPGWCDTPMHSLNYLFRQNGDHKHVYDAFTLERVLANAGFCTIRRREFEPGLDSARREKGSLYMDAKKPCQQHC
jgi:predicted SAM-dependent methyltransferase